MQYLKLAEEAVKYVRDTCGILASNREWDRKVEQNIETIKAKVGPAVGHGFELVSNDQDGINLAAEVVKHFKAGNCEQMSQVAFQYLAQQGVRPLELAYFKATAEVQIRPVGSTTMITVEPDHQFVVLRRGMKSKEKLAASGGEADMSEYTDWNLEAVICDAWAKRAYFAVNLDMESKLIGRFTGGQTALCRTFRLEDGAAWTPSDVKEYVSALK